ncbi:dihydroneopterin aldolase [Mergibacter septicus]|uniref:7,8-dihydroneopterin aldolase n=1 Tax=Mergibacter septicus TaxID=221402 RepID=A0A8E3MDM2_9PAST|nr:dihydroneopterin aldolase [Mergibacter septicus]AWX15820.1 dihydroneopterin aldolase [Mergibacter septicus]QDJ13299.1 dihydroneopterin aldolase [Mergibacter septicus]QDJ15073.1 dihydroneopterin aldolase [Mergibacter septicus]UTU47503.1 dihydroneopterin aldolase [Mergibacter septicus]WMR95316.1 dihydroneopterin aldolase [Mergibacter septicus]
MYDIIFIEGLTVFAQIGVYDWEQQIKQKLIFDLKMAWDNQQASQTDNVQYCLNYAEVSEFILNYVENRAFLLIERVAHEVAEALQQQFNIPWIQIKLSKPTAVPQANNVGIIVEKGSLKSSL